MYSKKAGSIGSSGSSEEQAKEKLALYVYEYLCLNGALKASEMFLQETNFTNKNIAISEKPGFLQSWWSVFWDLYCAAPDRRDGCEPSQEAKMFHEYNCNINSGYPLTNGLHGPNPTPSPIGLAPGDGMVPGPASIGLPPPHGFYPGPGSTGPPPGQHMRPSPPQPSSASQPSPHGMINQSGFMTSRYVGPRGGMRMTPQDQTPYGASPGPPPIFPGGPPPGPGNEHSHLRMNSQMMQAPPPPPPHHLQQRLVGPPQAGVRGLPPHMNQNNFPMRPMINTSMGPGMASGAPMPRWPGSIQYGDPGSGQFPGPSMSTNNGPPNGPGTPIMRSPHSLSDGSAERYAMMPPGAGPPLGTYPMTSVDGGLTSVGEMLMNGVSAGGNSSGADGSGLDIKHSPGNGSGGCGGILGGGNNGGTTPVVGPNNASNCPSNQGPGSQQVGPNGNGGNGGPGSVNTTDDYGNPAGNQFQGNNDCEAEIQKIKDSITAETKALNL